MIIKLYRNLFVYGISALLFALLAVLLATFTYSQRASAETISATTKTQAPKETVTLPATSNKVVEPIRTSIFTQQVGYSVDFDNGESEISYEPNVGYRYGVALSYDGYAASIYAPTKPSLDDRRLRGTSSGIDLSLSYFSKAWGVEGFYTEYRGFHREKKETAVDASDVEIRSDMQSEFYGINTHYAFNSEKYNIHAIQHHEYDKLTTGSSWVAGIGVRQFRIRSNEGLIKDITLKSNGYDADLKTAEATNIIMSGGWAGVWASSKHVVFGGLTLGYGPQWQSITYDHKADKVFGIGNSARLDLAYAYQFVPKRFAAGMGIYADSDSASYSAQKSVGVTRRSTMFFIDAVF